MKSQSKQNEKSTLDLSKEIYNDALALINKVSTYKRVIGQKKNCITDSLLELETFCTCAGLEVEAQTDPNYDPEKSLNKIENCIRQNTNASPTS